MNPIFKKLHLPDKDPVLVLNAPEDYYELLEELNVDIHDEVQDDYHFVQVFAQDEEEANDVITEVLTVLQPGAFFWFSYPKSSSEKFETELDERAVLKIFDAYDFIGVTKVSLNDDWHAIRLKFSGDDDIDDFTSLDKGPKKFNANSD